MAITIMIHRWFFAVIAIVLLTCNVAEARSKVTHQPTITTVGYNSLWKIEDRATGKVLYSNVDQVLGYDAKRNFIEFSTILPNGHIDSRYESVPADKVLVYTQYGTLFQECDTAGVKYWVLDDDGWQYDSPVSKHPDTIDATWILNLK